MADSIQRVRGYYEARGESEWHRLALPFDGAIEKELHRRTFEHYLPSGSRVLDLGGGPGRWTIWLAGRGHRVVLADLSRGLLEIARREVAIAGVGDLVEAIVEADARDLSRWPAGSFDAVLALGPFYHLVDADVLAGLEAPQEVARPGVEVVHPCLHRVQVTAEPLHPKLAAPAVVHGQTHRRLAPAPLALGPVKDHARQLVVTVREDVRLDHHPLPDHALDRIAAAVDLRVHSLYDHAASRVNHLGGRQPFLCL